MLHEIQPDLTAPFDPANLTIEPLHRLPAGLRPRVELYVAGALRATYVQDTLESAVGDAAWHALMHPEQVLSARPYDI